MKLQIFTTGGTIDKVYFDALSLFETGSPVVVGILANANVNFDYSIDSILQKDSLDITELDRKMIIDRVSCCNADRILLSHGTDTMCETATALEAIRDKTIVMVGSMQPAVLNQSDATFNIGFAVACAQILPAGVYIAMSGIVIPSGKARKNRALQRFEFVTNSTLENKGVGNYGYSKEE